MSKFILSAFGDEIDVNIEKQMDVLEKHNIHYIELRGVNGKEIVEYTLDEVKDIKKQLDARGFKVSSIASPIGKISINDDFEPHLKLFQHTIEIGKIMETKYVRMFSFFIPNGENPLVYRDEVMNRWTKFIEIAKNSGIMLLHENEKDIYGDTVERCVDLIKTMNCSYLKAIFDPANFVQCDVEAYPYAYELLKDYVEYIHIKDALFSNHEVVPAGQGDGNIKEILSSFCKDGFEGFLSIEPHLGDFEGFAALENNAICTNSKKSDSELFAIAANALKIITSEMGVEFNE